MFISNLPITVRVALRAANEAVRKYDHVAQPEILFEDLRGINRIGPFEGTAFLIRYLRYRPFGQDRKNDYEVRVGLKRDWEKTGYSTLLEADGFALVSRQGRVPKTYPFEVTWSGTQDGPMVIFKREMGGLFPTF